MNMAKKGEKKLQIEIYRNLIFPLPFTAIDSFIYIQFAPIHIHVTSKDSKNEKDSKGQNLATKPTIEYNIYYC